MNILLKIFNKDFDTKNDRNTLTGNIQNDNRKYNIYNAPTNSQNVNYFKKKLEKKDIKPIYVAQDAIKTPIMKELEYRPPNMSPEKEKNSPINNSEKKFSFIKKKKNETVENDNKTQQCQNQSTLSNTDDESVFKLNRMQNTNSNEDEVKEISEKIESEMGKFDFSFLEVIEKRNSTRNQISLNEDIIIKINSEIEKLYEKINSFLQNNNALELIEETETQIQTNLMRIDSLNKENKSLLNKIFELREEEISLLKDKFSKIKKCEKLFIKIKEENNSKDFVFYDVKKLTEKKQSLEKEIEEMKNLRDQKIKELSKINEKLNLVISETNSSDCPLNELILQNLAKLKSLSNETVTDLEIKEKLFQTEKENSKEIQNNCDRIFFLEKEIKSNSELIQNNELQTKRINSDIKALGIKLQNLEDEKQSLLALTKYKEVSQLSQEIKSIINLKNVYMDTISEISKSNELLLKENKEKIFNLENLKCLINKITKELNIAKYEYLLILIKQIQIKDEKNVEILKYEMKALEELDYISDTFSLNKKSEFFIISETISILNKDEKDDVSQSNVDLELCENVEREI